MAETSVFIKRAAHTKCDPKGLGISQQACSIGNVHLNTARQVVKNGILVFGIMYESVGQKIQMEQY